MRKRANPKAGQGLLHAPTGKHTRNPGWKAGEHWLCCQRCGFDFYSKDMKKEWSGAIVCKTCWEPRHPQDFVRGRPERIQAQGLVNPCSILSGADIVAAAGSTEIPAPTFNLGSPTITAIADQACQALNTAISTVTGAVFGTFVDTHGITITVSSYGVDALPGGLSINASTGDITGTPDTDSATTTFQTTVYAIYSNGQRISALPFTWCIIDAGLAPEDIAGLCMWYDFSDDSKVYSDLAGTVLAGNGDRVRKVVSSLTGGAYQIDSGTGNPFFCRPESDSDNYAPTFNTSANGTLSAVEFDPSLTDAGNQAILLPGWNPPLSAPNGFTFVGIVEIPTGQASSLPSYYFGSQVSGGHNIGLSATNLGFKAELQSMVSGVGQDTTNFDGAWSLEVGNWFMFCFRQYVDGPYTKVKYQFNNMELSAGDFDTHPWREAVQGVSRIGCGDAWTTSVPEGPWNGLIGEVLVYCDQLSDADVTSLFDHMNAKWSLTSTPP